MKKIRISQQNTTTVVLLVALGILYFLEKNSSFIEKYYSSGLYSYSSVIQRVITSWLPFSIGDFLYVGIICTVVVKLFIFLWMLFNNDNKWKKLFYGLKKTGNYFLGVLIFFKLAWGLNYSRQGISQQLNLEKNNYTKEELIEMVEDFIFKANWCRKQVKDSNLAKLDFEKTLSLTKMGYSKARLKYNFLNTSYISVKPSFFSFLGNYLGYTGYYNPFTGEAQIRNDIPAIVLPFVSCHEVAHQLGYASEDEASFVAFLVAENSNDVLLKYSTYLEMIDYGFNELFLMYAKDSDFKSWINQRLQLENCFDELVQEDRAFIHTFFKKNKKNTAAFSASIYDSYLKSNKQSLGIGSYSKVMLLIFNLLKKS